MISEVTSETQHNAVYPLFTCSAGTHKHTAVDVKVMDFRDVTSCNAKVSEEATYQTTRRYIPDDRDHTSFLLLLWTTSNMLADFAKNEVAI
jgi:hypothetical protein